MEIEIKNNKLFFDGCDTVELAKEYGTPLYVVSENEILNRINELKECFIDKYQNVRVAYAAKAFFPLYMGRLIKKQNICVDVVSGGELYTAIKAGISPEHIEFNGNNKLYSELEEAIDYGVGRIIVDGFHELDLIEDICSKKNERIEILLRLTPGVKTSSHDYIVTGKKDSKFGFTADEETVLPIVKKALASKHIHLKGFHFHVGSQLFENDYHLEALRKVLDLFLLVNKETGWEIEELNVGGGFGAKYIDEDRKPFSYFLDPIMEAIKDFFEKNNKSVPTVAIEPGRSIVAEAGITLYSVGEIKEIKDLIKYVSVDGGMADNIRPALYQAEYTAIVANKADKNYPDKEVVSICGKCCESGDILIKNIELPRTEMGDIIALLSTGAYGYSMASNYNKIPKPAVVAVKDGKAEAVVRRQTFEDMTREEI